MRRFLPLLSVVFLAPGCLLFERIEDPIPAIPDSSLVEDAQQETSAGDASVDGDDTSIGDARDAVGTATGDADSSLAIEDGVANDADAAGRDALSDDEMVGETLQDASDTEPGDVVDAQPVVDASFADVPQDAPSSDTLDARDAADACSSLACTTPPPPTCASDVTRRTFENTGSCAAGTCSYPTVDTACGPTQACVAGVCVPRSCRGGLSCNGESCCTSPLIPAGTFSRSYDGVTYADAQYSATVAGFRLDKYEVTVGRFRNFVGAVMGGWRPAAGSGKHTHLGGGAGLNGGTETGWDATWNDLLLGDKASWDQRLACGGVTTNISPTWTPTAAANEKHPVNCVTWYQAFAFCAFDGGFLPTEAEWNYAAAGGNEQRVYPWGATAPVADTMLAVYGCYYGPASTPCTTANIAPVGSIAAGNGKWGQSDLAGSMWEWTLDMHRDPYTPIECVNCAQFGQPADNQRLVRGGGWLQGNASLLTASFRAATSNQGVPDHTLGFRCGRIP